MTPSQVMLAIRVAFLGVRGVHAITTDKQVREEVGGAVLKVAALPLVAGFEIAKAVGKAAKAWATRKGPLVIDSRAYPYIARRAKARNLDVYQYDAGFTLDKCQYFATMAGLEANCKNRWWRNVGICAFLIALAALVLVQLFFPR